MPSAWNLDRELVLQEVIAAAITLGFKHHKAKHRKLTGQQVMDECQQILGGTLFYRRGHVRFVRSAYSLGYWSAACADADKKG